MTHTIRLRCTEAYEHHLTRKGWQWGATLDDAHGENCYSFEMQDDGRCPYMIGREYDVTVREVGDERSE